MDPHVYVAIERVTVVAARTVDTTTGTTGERPR